MNGPGTLKIAFIYRDKQDSHPLARFCPPLPAATPKSAANGPPLALPLPGATALFDVTSKFIETGVSSLVDAVAMRMRSEATTLDATIPVDGFYKAGGLNDIDDATLVLHNGVDRTATDPSFNLSLSIVVSPDSTAFRLRVYIWNINRFLNPRPRALGQTAERDWLLRIEFLTPGSAGLGSRTAIVELALPAVTLDELQDALYAGQDLHWLPMPALPVALAGGGGPGNIGHYLPFNVRATIVETTKPGLFAKWVEESLLASKATLSKAAVAEFRSVFDPAQKAADDAKQMESANTAFTNYRKTWDTFNATVAAAPTTLATGAAPSEIAKHAAARATWEADVAIQEKAVSFARSTAIIALHKAGIGWPGDFPKIVTPPQS
ncbi:hypothetical protein [Hydrogenophaga sp.]|uniref:hypothetical protein n=1 Tax=Hydrogenophaga sp. TaxID=1904254 RepID=UPI0025C61934|nr:hypothetical protein [Hydrogenophaga sp.]MBT9466235.1 hypothetical protein [Hydrogenophaga sp.]